MGHIQSAFCAGQTEVVTAAHNRCNRLIQAEIRAGRDTVAFIQESEKETHILQVELDRYEAYAAKLENDIVLAQDMEARAERTW